MDDERPPQYETAIALDDRHYKSLHSNPKDGRTEASAEHSDD